MVFVASGNTATSIFVASFGAYDLEKVNRGVCLN